MLFPDDIRCSFLRVSKVTRIYCEGGRWHCLLIQLVFSVTCSTERSHDPWIDHHVFQCGAEQSETMPRDKHAISALGSRARRCGKT